ncbi:MAG: LysM peptidoglycan-binding domain-containing protein [Chloroflexota bacterium]
MFWLLRLLITAASGLLLPLLLLQAVAAQTHTVEPGDSLSYIAHLYSVAIDDIVSLNNIPNPDVIFSGEKLQIPGTGTDDSSPSTNPTTYTIEEGDTLSKIANKYGVTVDELTAANNIEDVDFIVIGQTLTIPGLEVAEPAPQPDAIPVPPPPLQFPEKPYDPDIEAMIEEFSADYGVNPNTVKALATIESGWCECALSWVGAQGVMQIMPGTAQWLEDNVFGYQLNEEYSAYDNIKMGVKYLSLLLESTGGDERLAVASYYQGLAPTFAGVFYPDTTDYVNMIYRVRDAYWPS